MIKIKMLVVCVLALFGIVGTSSAQDRPAIEVHPIFSAETYNRMDIGAQAIGYDNSGSKYRTLQKGIAATFNSTGNFQVTMKVSTGSLARPTEYANLTGGYYTSQRLGDNYLGTTTFSGRSRTFDVAAGYNQKVKRIGLTYTAGVGYMTVQTTASYSETGFGITTLSHKYSFLMPKFGIKAASKFGRVTPQASIGGSLWVNNHLGYNYYQNYNGFGYVSSGARGSRYLEMDLGAAVDIVKNRIGITGGWKSSTVYTNYGMDTFGNTLSTSQNDSWKGIYVGLRYSR